MIHPMSGSRVRRVGAILLALSLVSAGRSDQRITQPFAGLTYIDRVAASPRPLHMHIVQIDLTAPGVRVELSPPGGGREVVRRATAVYANEVHAQAAVN